MISGTPIPVTDVHQYRDAIAKECRIGTCSANNCLYPWCAEEKPMLTIDPNEKPQRWTPPEHPTGSEVMWNVLAWSLVLGASVTLLFALRS